MMSHRIAVLSAVSLALVHCGGQALVQTAPDGNDGGVSSSGSGSGGSSGSSGSSGGSSSGTGSSGSSGGSSSGTGSSGSSGGPDASEDGPSCVGHYDGGPRPAPTDHRAQPGTCPATEITNGNCLSGYADGGAGATCSTSADCVPDGSYTPYSTCLHGHCAVDQCLADADCPSGQACLCGSLQYGNACFHANQCVTADCRLDSDCGAGSYCSPNFGCGIESGYHCHKATDSCFDDADCTCAEGYGATCAYSSAAGAWVCSQIVCAG
jgi:hypothetical protein